MGSRARTTLLLAVLTVIIIWMGGFFGGRQGMFLAFLVAALMNFGSYWFSDKIVLRMYNAREVSEAEAPGLHSMVRGLAANARIPMPRLYVIPDDSPNAFATGRNPEHAAVAVTEGITRLLTPNELRGVLAHELSHVANRDILVSSIAATLGGVIMLLADMARFAAFFGGGRSDDEEGSGAGGVIGVILVSILAPIAAMLIQMAISRSREYLADESGARFSHDPEALARALEKLTLASRSVPMVDAKPATAHLFIVNPLAGRSLANLFSTHPPLEDRIRRLRAMRIR